MRELRLREGRNLLSSYLEVESDPFLVSQVYGEIGLFQKMQVA